MKLVNYVIMVPLKLEKYEIYKNKNHLIKTDFISYPIRSGVLRTWNNNIISSWRGGRIEYEDFYDPFYKAPNSIEDLLTIY